MKRLFTCLILSGMLLPAHAQEMLGIVNSNYSGTIGLSLNPSSMVDSRLKFDVNLVTYGVSADNNYLYIPKSELKFFGLKNSDNLDKKDTGYTDKKNFDENDIDGMLSKVYKGTANGLFRVPSITFAVKDNFFGFRYTLRESFSASDIPAPIAKWAYSDTTFHYGPLLNKSFSFDNMKATGAAWGELAFSYGRVLHNEGPHYINGAITVKRVYGYYSGYVNMSASNVMSNKGNCDTCYSITSDHSTIDYGVSYQEADSDQTSPKVKGTGWGFDIGFTYEYRPDDEQHYYKMDNETLIDPEQNQYKWKLGLSILDIGKIKFKNGSVFHLDGSPNVDNYDTINAKGFNEINKTLSAIYYNGDSTRSAAGHEFDMALPHALSIQADYHAYKRLYGNMTWIQAIKPGSQGPVTNSLISLTPRYESPNFEAALPLSFYQYNKFHIGLGICVFNILTVGSDNIGSLMGFSDLEGMDAYFSLKVGIRKKKISDKDRDQVSDLKDKCPLDKGPWETLGCPDRDLDGIVDKQDSCPDVKGLAQFHGCPDTDSDGVQDKSDLCPTIAGLAKFSGCPDLDGDDVPDRLDSCPDVKGLIQFNGCPDTDNDGIIDKLDSCPLVAGPLANHGCPVIIAKAPLKPVELNKEEKEVINKVFKNLEFETGKWVIRPSSYAALDELAALLKRKPNFQLLIDGHTDNVGSAASNLQLSRNRAESVKTYLSDKGIDPKRITATGYGLTKPIAPNKTPQGRQKNRRVEFTIVE